MVSVPSTEGEAGLVLNRYKPICRLGRGGQADVYLATTPGPGDFHRLVVIKVLRSRGGAADKVAGFLDEAKLSARLNHPNVVQTLEVSEYRGRPCIVMEHLEGQSLDRVRRALGSRHGANDALWARVISDALAGLSYAHELADYDRRPLNIVHRDISPENIFITYHGQVKILDFGIAQSASVRSQTEDGKVRGKANYMAPEQARGKAVDARADLFSMGIVFWELLTGERLIDADGVSALYQLLDGDIPRVRDVRPDIDPRLDDIVARALERDPDRRFQTAAAMREAVESYLATMPKPPRADDVGYALQNEFASERDAVRRKVRQFMNQRPDSATGPYTLTADSMRVPVLLSNQPGPLERFTTGTVAPPSRFWPIAALLVLAMGAGVFWFASRPASDPTGAPATAVATSAPAASNVIIDSDPAGAVVMHGERKLGVTPVAVPLALAPATVTLTAPGYADATAQLIAGDPTSQLIVLTSEPAASDTMAEAKGTDSESTEAHEPPTLADRGGPLPRRVVNAETPKPEPAEPDPPAKPAPPPAKRAPPPTTTPSVTIITDDKPKVRVID